MSDGGLQNFMLHTQASEHMSMSTLVQYDVREHHSSRFDSVPLFPCASSSSAEVCLTPDGMQIPGLSPTILDLFLPQRVKTSIRPVSTLYEKLGVYGVLGNVKSQDLRYSWRLLATVRGARTARRGQAFLGVRAWRWQGKLDPRLRPPARIQEAPPGLSP